MPEIDPNTAYVVCITVSLGFPYTVSVFPCFPYMISHYDDVRMGAIASQITSLTIVYSTVYSVVDQRKHQSYASPAFVRGIHRIPMNSPHKRPVTRKMFPFDDVLMHMPLFPYMAIQPIVLCMGCYGLFIVPRTAIETPQWYDRYCFTGYARTWARHPTTRMHDDYINRFFVGFNANCNTFLINNPIYIEGGNCRLNTVPGLFKKCSGLRPSETLSELVARLATSCARG